MSRANSTDHHIAEMSRKDLEEYAHSLLAEARSSAMIIHKQDIRIQQGKERTALAKNLLKFRHGLI